MAKPVLERLQLVGMIGVGSVAIVALLQFAAITALIVLPKTSMVPERAALRLVVAAGAVAIVLVLAGLWKFVIQPNEREWRRLVARAEERRQRFRSIFEEHPDAIVVYNVDGTIVRANPSADDLLGLRGEIAGKPWREHVAASERAEMDRQFQYACAGHVAKFETVFLDAAGDEIPVMWYIVPTIVEGSVVSVVGTARDLREIKRAMAREHLQTERIAALAEIKSKYAAHPHQQIQNILEFTCATLGMEEAAVSSISDDTLTVKYSLHRTVRVGHTVPFDKTFARHTYGAREVLAIADATTPEWRDDAAVEFQAWKAYIGSTIFVESVPYGIMSFTRRDVRPSDFDKADRDFVRIGASLIGSSLERIRSESELAVAALHDKVTGLANRAAFEEHLRSAIARAARHGGHVRVHFIDLDGFKAVNDSLGHAAGDEVLRIIAARFRALARAEDVVARLGGDEFIILESTIADESDSAALGNRIVAAAAELMYVAGKIVRIGASVGVAAYPRHAKDEAALLACADSAMYSAKSAGKGSVKLYSYG